MLGSELSTQASVAGNTMLFSRPWNTEGGNLHAVHFAPGVINVSVLRGTRPVLTGHMPSVGQNPSCASACSTRKRIASDCIGNAREKSARVSELLRSRTFDVQ